MFILCLGMIGYIIIEVKKVTNARDQKPNFELVASVENLEKT